MAKLLQTRVELPMPDLMLQIINELWRTPRHIVSDGYDEALARLGDFLPLTVHEVPSGTQCWTWRIPNKWGCQEAWIEADGQRLVDVRLPALRRRRFPRRADAASALEG
jgi:aminopeptidase-like protein